MLINMSVINFGSLAPHTEPRLEIALKREEGGDANNKYRVVQVGGE